MFFGNYNLCANIICIVIGFMKSVARGHHNDSVHMNPRASLSLKFLSNLIFSLIMTAVEPNSSLSIFDEIVVIWSSRDRSKLLRLPNIHLRVLGFGVFLLGHLSGDIVRLCFLLEIKNEDKMLKANHLKKIMIIMC